jgi:hypothetical protein
MNMEDRPKIAIDAGRGSGVGANFHPFHALGVNRFQVRGIKAFDRGAGEQQSGGGEEGYEAHTFILR